MARVVCSFRVRFNPQDFHGPVFTGPFFMGMSAVVPDGIIAHPVRDDADPESRTTMTAI